MVFYELQYGDSRSKGKPWVWFYNTKAQAARDAKMLSDQGWYIGINRSTRRQERTSKFRYRIFKREWTTRTIVAYMNSGEDFTRKLANPKALARSL
jgi:hypothetical protein